MAQPDSVLQQKGAQLARNPSSGSNGKHLGQNLSFGLSVFADDTWSVGDAVARIVGWVRRSNDAVSVFDAPTTTQAFGFRSNDSWTVGDVGRRATARAVFASDAITAADSATAGKGVQRTASDATGIGDSAKRAVAEGRTANDSWVRGDAATRLLPIVRGAQDAWTATDAAKISYGLRVTGDVLVVGDHAFVAGAVTTVLYTDLPAYLYVGSAERDLAIETVPTGLAIEREPTGMLVETGLARGLTIKLEPSALVLAPDAGALAVEPEREVVLIDG